MKSKYKSLSCSGLIEDSVSNYTFTIIYVCELRNCHSSETHLVH